MSAFPYSYSYFNSNLAKPLHNLSLCDDFSNCHLSFEYMIFCYFDTKRVYDVDEEKGHNFSTTDFT